MKKKERKKLIEQIQYIYISYTLILDISIKF